MQVSLPPDLFAAVIATLPPREDRVPDGPVFPGLTQERLRTAIARACKLATSRLGVEPNECFYVGDGADSELEGAREIGMQAGVYGHRRR